MPAVRETFFSLDVGDMARATGFYVGALAARVMFASAGWTSISIAGVRIGLFLNPQRQPGRTGMHFVVDDLVATCDAITQAGGRVLVPRLDPAPGVVIAEVVDSEGNGLTLRRA
jgi:predicted enzyme related to lactoylglutathione lyase